jgi:hypothetical protein
MEHVAVEDKEGVVAGATVEGAVADAERFSSSSLRPKYKQSNGERHDSIRRTILC